MAERQHVDELLADVLAADRTKILARIVSLVGDLQLAEDALQEASLDAANQWRNELPSNPQGWLITVARRRAIDQYRSLSASDRRTLAFNEHAAVWTAPSDAGPLSDDRLRLIFTCAHPALSMEARVALTLQVVGGLTAADIASGFLVSDATMSQRIVRAKAKIRAAKIPYRVPAPEEWDGRLASVLAVIYLIFTTGHLAPRGDDAIRVDLLDEAIRLSELLIELVEDPEVLGLGALLLVTDARRGARRHPTGELIDLQSQDRRHFDTNKIAAGLALLRRANGFARPGPYQLQAMIAAVHAKSPSAEETDWVAIAELYDGLIVLVPSPVVAMNRAVAVGHARSPREGLALLDEPSIVSALGDHHRLHAARAHLLEVAGDAARAHDAWRHAANLAPNAHERLALERLAAACAPPSPSPKS